MVGMNYIYPMALFLPALEMVLGVRLVAGIWRRGASLLTAALHGAFHPCLFFGGSPGPQH